MKSLGIKYQLRMITLIPVLLVALFFALFYNAQYDKALNQHISRLGHAFISQLLLPAQIAIVNKDKDSLQKMVDTSLVNPEIQAIAIYDNHGRLLACHGAQFSHSISFKPPRHTTHAMTSTKRTPYSINFVTAITSSKHDKKSPLGWISLDMDTKFILIKRYQTYIMTIFITLIGLVIGLSTHYILSRRMYRPITRLRRSMRQILNNEFETTIKVSTKGEIGIIEEGCAHLQKQYMSTINDLNQYIETATADLQQSLELLEEKNIELSLEKKKAEEKSRQKSAFIANMSHEVRTPMNGVIGFTNVLLESQLDPLQLDYVKTIKSSAQDLLSIINDILDYSKIDAGKLHLDCIPVNIRGCIDEVLSLIAPNAHKKGIDLIPATDVNVPATVLGDPLRLKQMISCLISNAVKFTDYGYVLIRTKIEQESDRDYSLCISVIDTGIGISTEDQKTLFNAFNQANTTITRRYGGSGLGLVICKQLAENMQGRIVIKSEIHKGSTFSVYLKLEKLAAYEIERHQTHRFANIKAICFDDNPLHLEAICNGLGFWGVNCIPVQAFNQLDDVFRMHPDCQVAFINVNQGCEQQVADVLHKQSVPCLLVSKWFIRDYQSLGAQGLLFKPPNIQKLYDGIEAVLNQAYMAKNNHHELTDLRSQLQKSQLNILIAEDNIVNRRLLNSLLGENACLDHVDNGEQAVNLCNQKRFSIILLDLQMPILNGLDAAKMISQDSMLNKYTPIVLISANASNLNNEDLQKYGITCCLQKPIDEKQLLQNLLQLMKESNTKAINWSLCVQKVSGNHALAVEFLAHFIDELHKNRVEFLHMAEQNDLKGLEQLAHKLHGACCFCGVTQLQHAVAVIEQVAGQAQHLHVIQTEFSQLIQNIDAVILEYDRSFYAYKLNLTTES